jgi:CubicO group peptidase (beta-lactamase class C family)
MSAPRVGSAPAGAAARIGSLLEAAHARGIFNGAALVARGPDIVYRGEIGFADGERTRSLGPEDRFSIGSIAKEFTAVAIMILEKRGAMSLEDPVSRFIPDLPAWATKIRVRHLLDYTSGLPEVRATGVTSEEDLMNDLRSLPALGFEPGAGYLYSNNNIMLRRKVIEAVTAKRYADFAQAELFEPCGMSGAITDAPPAASHVARGFDNAFVGDVVTYSMPGWTLVTATDLHRWTQCLDFGNLLPRSSVVRLIQTADNRQGGLGKLELSNGAVRRHVHDGSSYNSQALLYVDVQEGITVLLLTRVSPLSVGVHGV